MLKTHTFKGKCYTVRIDPAIGGLCDNPDSKLREIVVLERLTTRNGLRILLHESLHALDWSKSESEVEQAAQDLSGLLWRLGFRLSKNKSKR
jgi:hypothetical protein